MKIDLRGVHLGQGMFSSQKRKRYVALPVLESSSPVIP